jgi:hypothetical protein
VVVGVITSLPIYFAINLYLRGDWLEGILPAALVGGVVGFVVWTPASEKS